MNMDFGAEMPVRLLHKLSDQGVRVVGVTKGRTRSEIEWLVEGGISELGINYAQDFSPLYERFGQRVKWHFIGHIQSRKVRHLLNFDCIHSVDRLEVAQELNRRLQNSNRTIDILSQVNIGEEPTKSGIAPGEIVRFIEGLRPFKHLRCRGLMALPPALTPVEARRVFFAKMRELFESHRTPEWNTLSMGTSQDFEIAVEEGATLVRLGTVLFAPEP